MNVVEHVLEIRREPSALGYRLIRLLQPDDPVLPLALDGMAVRQSLEEGLSTRHQHEEGQPRAEAGRGDSKGQVGTKQRLKRGW